MPGRLEHRDLVRIVLDARAQLAATYWWHRSSGGVYVVLGVVLRESDLTPLVRYFPHGRTGVEFARPIDEFLERFEPTETPLWTGTPISG